MLGWLERKRVEVDPALGDACVVLVWLHEAEVRSGALLEPVVAVQQNLGARDVVPAVLLSKVKGHVTCERVDGVAGLGVNHPEELLHGMVE